MGQRSKYADKDGALIRVTPSGKEHCYMHACDNLPKNVITFYQKKVWVCKRHSTRDGFKS